MESEYRIRKLTEREHYRLMGFSDEDFEKAQSVLSKTQLYKTSGNSIIREVLMGLFSQMHIKDVPVWNELSEEEIKELCRHKGDLK